MAYNKDIHHEKYEEPKVNFEREKEHILSNTEVNQLALKVQETIKQYGIEFARETFSYFQLFDLFYGYRGEKTKNTVQHYTDSIWVDVTDESSITEQSWKNLETSIQNYNPKTGNFVDFANTCIKKTAGKQIKEQRIKRTNKQVSTEVLGSYDDDGSYKPYEVEDIISFFDLNQIFEKDEVAGIIGKLVKETPGKDKEKKLFILKNMVAGELINIDQKRKKRDRFNAAVLSEVVAEEFGGKAESHRKYINRFRKHAEKILSNQGKKLNTTYTGRRKKLIDKKIKAIHDRAKNYAKLIETPSEMDVYNIRG